MAADAALRAVILTGAGPKAFAAGADIGELNALPDARAAEAQARRGQALTRSFERLRVPVIAAVNGFALGGGCELATACDIRRNVVKRAFAANFGFLYHLVRTWGWVMLSQSNGRHHRDPCCKYN